MAVLMILAGILLTGAGGLATAFFLIRGYPVLLVNQRGAGPSRAACRNVYHAGSSDDFGPCSTTSVPGSRGTACCR